MDESCAYCGDEILSEAVRRFELAYCCRECLDAAEEDQFDFIDSLEYDEV
jgi:hypothetical protein